MVNCHSGPKLKPTENKLVVIPLNNGGKYLLNLRYI